MAHTRRKPKDRTSLIIAVVLHAIVIGGVVYWAHKTGRLERLRQSVLQYVRSDKPQKPDEAKPQAQSRQPPPKLPPINQGLPAASAASSGTRRAVAADAPAAAGETFFQDTRAQTQGAATGPAVAKREEPKKAAAPPPAPKPPAMERPLFRAAGQSTVKALLQERAKAAAAVESFGAEQISKSSVSDAGDIVSKVSGATVVEGKYAVIRGLTDRYSAATLNGAELPSADPYRRSAALDMFPAKIIDRVTVTKTFTPDQPGSFTGGNINIVTKSFPDRPFASFEIGASYNSQTTGNENFLTYDRGGTDWLGMDDGSRSLASEFWDFTLTIPAYRSQLGRPINSASPSPSVQRTLADAMELERLAELAGPTQFGPTRKAPPPAHAFVASAGDTGYLFGRPVGLFLSVPYGHSYSYYDAGVVTRVNYNEPGNPQLLEVDKAFTEEKGTEEVNWAATATLASEVWPDQQLGYAFIFNQYSEDSARIRVGQDYYNMNLNLDLKRLQYIERNLTSHQFRGGHRFQDLGGLRADWLATFTQTTQDEPDTRFYNVNGNRFNISGLDPKFPTRYWRELEEDSRNLRLDFLLPFHPTGDAADAEFKFGLFDNQAERNYRERTLAYNTAENWAGDPNALLTPDRLGAVNPPATNGNFVTYTWQTFLQTPSDRSFYTGESHVPAAYAMLDFSLLEPLRLVGGVRFEQTDIQTTSFSTVPSEGVVPGTTNSPPPLQRDDLLPSLGLVWNVVTNMNVRLNYGQTLARPSFRELAAVRTYDPVLDEYIVGNPRLQITDIQNYDLRWEWFPRPGEILSVGLFYKDLENVIEKEFVSSRGDIVTFVNRPKAQVAGVELEARKSLEFLSWHLRHWSLGGNLTLMESSEEISDLQQANHTRPDLLGDTRPLADQSPYIINLDLSYDNPHSGTSLSVGYNVFGPRLIIANLAAPDIYEQPAPLLDVVLSQRLGRHLRLKLSARNLLDPEIERTYGEEAQAIYSSYTRGRTFGVSLTYDF